MQACSNRTATPALDRSSSSSNTQQRACEGELAGFVHLDTTVTQHYLVLSVWRPSRHMHVTTADMPALQHSQLHCAKHFLRQRFQISRINT
jgi:hypothetical protein